MGGINNPPSCAVLPWAYRNCVAISRNFLSQFNSYHPQKSFHTHYLCGCFPYNTRKPRVKEILMASACLIHLSKSLTEKNNSSTYSEASAIVPSKPDQLSRKRGIFPPTTKCLIMQPWLAFICLCLPETKGVCHPIQPRKRGICAS